MKNVLMLVVTILMVMVTALNHYTTKKNCDLYLDGVVGNTNDYVRNLQVFRTMEMLCEKDRQIEKLVAVAQSEADRACRIEGEFNDLASKYVKMAHAGNKIAIDNYGLRQLVKDYEKHVKELHALMTKAGIKIPEFPGTVKIETKPIPNPKPGPHKNRTAKRFQHRFSIVLRDRGNDERPSNTSVYTG
jgi:hypothetical protein